jgi:hypothetical protein
VIVQVHLESALLTTSAVGPGLESRLRKRELAINARSISDSVDAADSNSSDFVFIAKLYSNSPNSPNGVFEVTRDP